jgi:hypothetical protein
LSDLITPLALRSEHLTRAQLFAERIEMVHAFKRPTERVGEVGVALGAFSKELIAAFRPRQFVAFDLFDLHTTPTIWGRPSPEVFGERTHLDHYIDTMANDISPIATEVGASHERLATHADASFDVLYIDGDHSYAQVKLDAEQAIRKIKPDGLLIFNDYVLCEPIGRNHYGVVPVVNELVVEGGWRMLALALHQYMFCDVVLQRA